MYMHSYKRIILLYETGCISSGQPACVSTLTVCSRLCKPNWHSLSQQGKLACQEWADGVLSTFYTIRLCFAAMVSFDSILLSIDEPSGISSSCCERSSVAGAA